METADASCSLTDKKNGFPIAVPIALGANWPELAPAVLGSSGLALEDPINHKPKLQLTHRQSQLKLSSYLLKGRK